MRKVEIEHERVVGRRGEIVVAVAAVRKRVDDVPVFGQAARDQRPQRLVVLYDENAHETSTPEGGCENRHGVNFSRWTQSPLVSPQTIQTSPVDSSMPAVCTPVWPVSSARRLRGAARSRPRRP